MRVGAREADLDAGHAALVHDVEAGLALAEPSQGRGALGVVHALSQARARLPGRNGRIANNPAPFSASRLHVAALARADPTRQLTHSVLHALALRLAALPRGFGLDAGAVGVVVETLAARADASDVAGALGVVHALP